MRPCITVNVSIALPYTKLKILLIPLSDQHKIEWRGKQQKMPV